MFDLLRTPDEHKELKLFDKDPIVAMNGFIKETLVGSTATQAPSNSLLTACRLFSNGTLQFLHRRLTRDKSHT